MANETLFRIYKNLDTVLERLGPEPLDLDALTQYAYGIARNVLGDSYRRESARKVEAPRFSSLSVDEPGETP